MATLLAVSSLGHPSVSVLISCSDKDTSHIGLGFTHMTSFYFIYNLKTLFLNTVNSEVLRVRTSIGEFQGTQFSP